MADFSQPIGPVTSRGVLSCRGQESMSYSYLVVASSWGGTVAWTTANQAVYQAVLVQDTVTVTHLAIIMIAASGNVDVGLYTEGGTKLVSSGSTAAAGSTAIQSFDVTDTTLTPGLYWLACAFDNTTVTVRGSAGGSYPTARARGVMVQSSAFPLPATATFAAPTVATNLPDISAMLRTAF